MHLDWTGSCCYTYCVDGSYRALGDLYLGICRITIMMWQFNHDSTDYGLPPVICLPENGLYYPQNGHQDLARMLIMITLPITYLRHLHHLVVTSSLGPMLRLACWLGYAARDTCFPPLWLHSTVNNCCKYCWPGSTVYWISSTSFQRISTVMLAKCGSPPPCTPRSGGKIGQIAV